MSSVNKDSVASSFLTWAPFTSLLAQLSRPEAPSTVVSTVVGTDTLSGSRSLGERLQSSTIECGVSCGLFIVVKFPGISGLLSVCHEGGWICPVLFLSLWMEVITVLHLVTGWTTVIVFHILGPSCISGINPYWSRCIILLVCCWVRFAGIG